MIRRFTWTLGLIVLTSVLLVASCYKSSTMEQTQAPPPAPNNVTIGDDFFNPGSLNVTAGTTVTWTNRGNRGHTVTSDQGAFDSGSLNPGGTFSFTFKDKGTFSYHCNFHSGMTAKIVVE
jgi:plastocyanin